MIMAEPTAKTPAVTLDEDTSQIHISGRSYPEDLHGFWNPVLRQIEDWVAGHPETEITFDLNYHNSGSTRIVINLIRFCESQLSENKQIKMIWLYDEEDEQTAEQGEDYADICIKLPFALQQK